MCDTFIAIDAPNRRYILGKNSDREPAEGQSILINPPMMHGEQTVMCTYISIPQVSATYGVILSKPFQMWGAEMGMNEHGLCIGNEAVFTKVKFDKRKIGLTGMDCLRLALERNKTVKDAINCITALIEEYGQDACGGYKNKSFYYHNSFLLADGHEAWVLETVGREWAAKRVVDHGSISNGLTIGTDYDLISPNAIDFAKSAGYFKESAGTFSFKQAYSDWLFTYFSKCTIRQATTQNGAFNEGRYLDVKSAMHILKQHNLPEGEFSPRRANAASICMHTTGMLNPSSTTGSMIADVKGDNRVIWLTCTAYPCTSVYFPFVFDGDGYQSISNLLDATNEAESLWHRHQLLYAMIKPKYKYTLRHLSPLISEFQAEVISGFEKQQTISSYYTISMLKLYNIKLTEWMEKVRYG